MDAIRETIVKRPTGSAKPEYLERSLKLAPACSGHMEKLATTSSMWVTWQMRYWELRGEHLLYFNAARKDGEEPLGAIALRQIKSVSISNRKELVLKSRSKEFKLRCSAAEVKGQSRTSVESWQKCIDEVRKQLQSRPSVQSSTAESADNADIVLSGEASNEDSVKAEDKKEAVEAASSAPPAVTLYYHKMVGRALPLLLILEVRVEPCPET
jgi:hypothetical protein